MQDFWVRNEKFRDFFSKTKLFLNSMSEPEKEHIIRAFHFEVGKVMSLEIRKAVVELFNSVEETCNGNCKRSGSPSP